MTLKTKTIGYWVTTTVLALALLSGGVAELTRQRQNVEGMVHLGYPLYFVSIIGFWKVLGVIAPLAPRFPRLKEWAYAGIFFNMTGAAAWHVIVTLTLAGLGVASWALRPESRILGALRTAKPGV